MHNLGIMNKPQNQNVFFNWLKKEAQSSKLSPVNFQLQALGLYNFVRGFRRA